MQLALANYSQGLNNVDIASQLQLGHNNVAGVSKLQLGPQHCSQCFKTVARAPTLQLVLHNCRYGPNTVASSSQLFLRHQHCTQCFTTVDSYCFTTMQLVLQTSARATILQLVLQNVGPNTVASASQLQVGPQHCRYFFTTLQLVLHNCNQFFTNVARAQTLQLLLHR